MTTTTVKMTVSGDTYKARTKLKDEGFTWDANAKEWSREYVAVDTEFGPGYADAKGHVKGTLKQIESMIRCYAKTDRFTVTVE